VSLLDTEPGPEVWSSNAREETWKDGYFLVVATVLSLLSDMVLCPLPNISGLL
jgi:hypothetical protein